MLAILNIAAILSTILKNKIHYSTIEVMAALYEKNPFEI